MPELCLPDVSRNPVLERQLVNRLKRIEGHVRGVQRLIPGATRDNRLSDRLANGLGATTCAQTQR